MIRLGDASDNNLSKDIDTSVPFKLDWVEASNNLTPFPTESYTKTTMCGGWINIYFFGAPGAPAGEVWAWRIHYAEWRSTPQPVESNFANVPGQAVTFVYRNASENTHNGAPSNIAFIPEDYSGVYVIDSYVSVHVLLVLGSSTPFH
jgi:hypothetical protein